MPVIEFPYGKEKLKANIDQSRLSGVLVSNLHNYKTEKSGIELVREAMANPIGSPKLAELAKDKKKNGAILNKKDIKSEKQVPMQTLPFSLLPVATEAQRRMNSKPNLAKKLF